MRKSTWLLLGAGAVALYYLSKKKAPGGVSGCNCMGELGSVDADTALTSLVSQMNDLQGVGVGLLPLYDSSAPQYRNIQRYIDALGYYVGQLNLVQSGK